MGNYNSQYESYYSKFAGNKKNYNPYGNYPYRNSKSSKNTMNSNFFTRRLLRELIGVFCLLFIVLICKIIVTPQTKAVYNYSRNIVNTNYDYTYLVNKAKTLNLMNGISLQQKFEDIIEYLKVTVTGGQTIKDMTQNNFITPAEGNIMPSSDKSAISIGVQEGSEIKAVFDGNIKECGEIKNLGKYILVNHGSGLVTRYSHLSEISVEKNSNIKKGDIIAKAGITDKANEPYFNFELMYMGENKDPLEYIGFDF